MANFKTHISTSTVLGIGYAGAGVLSGVPIDTCLLAGGLCGVSGMLPDIDSDSGIPIRESMSFAAAVIPMMLVDRFEQLGMSFESMVLVGGCLYILIRFGASKLLKNYTVHRGMFHSLPAAIIFTEVAFLLCGCDDLMSRLYKAGGVFIGFMSHLLLDELYSIEWARGRFRFKRSFGTAIKFFGSSTWGNISAYTKLILATILVLGEPLMLDQLRVPHGEQIYEAAGKWLRSHDHDHGHDHDDHDTPPPTTGPAPRVASEPPDAPQREEATCRLSEAYASQCLPTGCR